MPINSMAMALPLNGKKYCKRQEILELLDLQFLFRLDSMEGG